MLRGRSFAKATAAIVRVAAVAVVFLLFGWHLGLDLPSAQAGAAPLPTSRVIIITASGRHIFRVQVAATAESRARGLMFRRHLRPDQGMLFDLGPGQHDVIMWMKNTFIPLDMIFIGRDGTIRNIAADTAPLSRKLIPSGGPVKAVLEVAAGTARRLQIVVGDKVLNKIFK